MNNISQIHNCYGCGVCAVVCPRSIIDIRLNSNGFYEPYIEEGNKCVNCGLCLEVCAFNHQTIAVECIAEPRSYAAWSNDKRVQLKCSSGGVGFEIGKVLIDEEYKVCGVRYNAEKNRAEHYIASTEEELLQSIGSKYIQSFSVNAFQSIDEKQKYLVTGTPCQIDSFRRFIKKKNIEDNFVLLDFFCHSVPSMLVWDYYTALAEKKVGRIMDASWRNKTTGWHDSWEIGISGQGAEKKTFWSSKKSQGDLFYKLFLGDYYCNPACREKCKYKYNSSSADIRIGDLWGRKYSDNEDGVSALIAFTTTGQEVIGKLKGCTLIEHPFEIVAEGQMRKNVGKAYCALLMRVCLKWDAPLFIVNSVMSVERILRKLSKIFV